MKAEDMPTPRCDPMLKRLYIASIFCRDNGLTESAGAIEDGARLMVALERDLAVQTALAESLAAKAQELRLLVERAMGLLESFTDCFDEDGYFVADIGIEKIDKARAFRSEIRERKDE